MKMDRIEKQLNFVLEIDKMKQIGRQTYISDGTRKENDAEHSWHLAVMCMVLAEHANGELDMAKTMAMVLIHDIVEIDAGDTYAYDPKGNESKKERETAAADRIFSILPRDQAVYFRELWEEFERSDTAEARFAHSIDNLQPLLLNDRTNGKSWREHDVAKSSPEKRNRTTAEGSKLLGQVAGALIQKNADAGNLRGE